MAFGAPEVGDQTAVGTHEEQLDHDVFEDERTFVDKAFEWNLLDRLGRQECVDGGEVIRRIEQIDVLMWSRGTEAVEFFGPATEDPRAYAGAVEHRDDATDEVPIVGWRHKSAAYGIVPAMLILVRHAPPAATPDVSPHAWVLSDDGRAAAMRLVAALPADAYLVSSAEPKAWQTLEGDRLPVVRDARFNEVARENDPWDDDYRVRRRAYVEGVEHLGWEPRAAVAERFDVGVTERLAEANGRPVVIASHGMAITTWLSSRLGLTDPGEFWSQLRFPDAHHVDLDTGAVARLDL